MAAINRHKHHLAMLAHGKPDERKRVLRDAPDSLHDALAQVARMILSGKIKLTHPTMDRGTVTYFCAPENRARFQTGPTNLLRLSVGASSVYLQDI